MKLPWRKILWVYRSAERGWVVSIFKRQWHVTIERIPEPALSDVVLRALAHVEITQNVQVNNALLARLMKKGGV